MVPLNFTKLHVHIYSRLWKYSAIISLIFLCIPLFSLGILMRQIFVCLLMSHNSCRLSSLFFLFSKNVQECSLFSSNWIISKILSSTLQVLSLAVSCLLFMFCLLHFSFHLMYYLPPESVWSFFLKFLSLY